MFENEKYLCGVYEIGFFGEQFIGNGAIVEYPNGTRKAVTARHVAFQDNERPLGLVFRSIATNEVLAERPNFTRLTKRDISEVDIEADGGIPVAEEIDLTAGLVIIATLYGQSCEIPLSIESIGGRRPWRIPEAENYKLNRDSLISYTNVRAGNTPVKGISGAILLDKNYLAVALHSLTEKLSPYKGIGQILNSVKK